ncbi:unnamed protein product [Blepharisma stoltei]|uniref:Ankyrin repeat protein n=1 Tax=Blepharisma stoltei TaxID=1481888 RepID=A0AAU9J3H6_9CILI|nr:unnamed protein product [Blepharisma stoltei]
MGNKNVKAKELVYELCKNDITSLSVTLKTFKSLDFLLDIPSDLREKFKIPYYWHPSPLHLICYFKNYDLLEFVFEAFEHIDLNIQDNNGYTPLMSSIRKEDIYFCERLLEYGALHTTNNQFDNGDSPLHYACDIGNINIVKLLLDYGAIIDIPNALKITPLMYAVQKEHWKLVKVLLSYKSDPTIKDIYGDTALHWAIKKKAKKAIIDELIRGRDLTELLYDKNEEGITLLQLWRINMPNEDPLFLNQSNTSETVTDRTASFEKFEEENPIVLEPVQKPNIVLKSVGKIIDFFITDELSWTNN